MSDLFRFGYDFIHMHDFWEDLNTNLFGNFAKDISKSYSFCQLWQVWLDKRVLSLLFGEIQGNTGVQSYSKSPKRLYELLSTVNPLFLQN